MTIISQWRDDKTGGTRAYYIKPGVSLSRDATTLLIIILSLEYKKLIFKNSYL